MTESSKNEVDDVTGVKTTGHEWDGIRELDNPMPKWWLYTFYASIVWSLAYWVVMPAWPYLSTEGWTYTEGVIGYAQRDVVTREIAAVTQGGQGCLRRQLCALPRLRRTRLVGFPEPQRRRVALGRHAGGYSLHAGARHPLGSR